MARFIVIERGYGARLRRHSAIWHCGGRRFACRRSMPARPPCRPRHARLRLRQTRQRCRELRRHEIPHGGPGNATASEAEAQALVREHGSFVAALVTYNS